MADYISRQAAIDALNKMKIYRQLDSDRYVISDCLNKIINLPSAQPEPHHCRECKWSRCHINVDKHGKSETYWRCMNWDGETDEEGYCHEWER